MRPLGPKNSKAVNHKDALVCPNHELKKSANPNPKQKGEGGAAFVPGKTRSVHCVEEGVTKRV